jgi:Ca2+-binding EF-hand superfamily protein
VFGLIFAQGVNDHVIDAGVSSDSLYLYWGTLPRAMLTLYKTISGGLNWHDCVTPLAEVGAILVALFVGYISFAVFAVLNVITGIFCEAAIESSRKDHEMMIQQHLTEKENFTNAVCELFGVDKGEKGEDVWISYREFEDVLTHPKTSAYLATMQLDITDAWELFKLLDTDESSYIDVEEFVHGILRLKGLAKAIDVAKLDYEQKIRQKRLAKHMVAVDAKLTKIQKAMSICLSQSQQPTPLNATSEDDLFGPEPA